MKKIIRTAEIFGETRSLSSWAKIENIPTHIIYIRYSRGKRGEDLIKPYHERAHKKPIREREHPSIPLTEELLTYNNKTMNLKEWSLITGISLAAIMNRYRSKKTPKQILYVSPNLPTHIDQPKNNPCTQILVTYNNETRNLTQWSKLLNIPHTTILYRHKRHIEGHMTIEEILLGSNKRKNNLKRNSTAYMDSYFEPHPYIKHLQTALIASKLIQPKPQPTQPKPQPTQVIQPKPQPTQEQIQDANELRQQLQSLLKGNPKKVQQPRKITSMPQPLELTAEEKVKAGSLTTWLYRNKDKEGADIGAPFKRA